MNNSDYTQRLENIIKSILQPLKNIPFNLIIESMTGNKVLFFDSNNPEHKEVLNLLKSCAVEVGRNINKNGIARPRPNEVGNDIEKYIKEALEENGIKAGTPTSKNGQKKATGYPDIIFWYKNKPYYLECKTFNAKNINTTQRSFYFSPSDEFKVIYDAPHLLLSYEIIVAGSEGKNHIYKCKSYKILSIEKLLVDIKYEFNSDNKRMYSNIEGAKILAEGEIK